jgi:hypothetical protein
MSMKNAVLASAVASLFLSGAALAKHKTEKKSGSTVKCEGINECKGHGSCKSANNACKGQNGCKGRRCSSVKVSRIAREPYNWLSLRASLDERSPEAPYRRTNSRHDDHRTHEPCRIRPTSLANAIPK